MIVNHFLLSAGLIGLFFAVGHAVWVQKYVMDAVQSTEMATSTKRAIFGFLHYPTSMMVLSAVALVVASTFTNVSAAQPLAWFIVSINVGNLVVANVAAVIMNMSDTRSMMMPQTLVMVVWIAIIVAGIAL